MKLDFNNQTINEIIATIDENKATEWQLDILNFLKKYQELNSEIQINEMQGENIFTIAMKRENIQNTVKELNKYTNVKQGDTTLIANSITMKDGVIALAQAIEGKMEAYCVEPTNDIRIPYTGQDQNTIHWGLNYVYLTEAQVQQSSDVLHRIEKIAVETNGIKDETKELLISNNQDQMIYEVFSVKSFPIAVRKLNEENYSTIGNVNIIRSNDGQLIIDSPNFQERINTQKAVVINDDHSFRWLTSGEYLDDDNDTIINFDHIEEVLKPYIATRFVVMNFPEKESGQEMVTLIVERRYMEEFNYPTDGLKDHEIPKQTFFLGEFPENNDRAAIRKEVKRLLTIN
ncbi:MAG: hypothetical protein KIG88_05970 [Weeksellaceae bacterium]|nr:hypothetical protein [Weeksellaceae bacterium]